jgi:hypothetical protein
MPGRLSSGSWKRVSDNTCCGQEIYAFPDIVTDMPVFDRLAKESTCFLIQCVPAVDDIHVMIVVDIEAFEQILKFGEIVRRHTAPSWDQQKSSHRGNNVPVFPLPRLRIFVRDEGTHAELILCNLDLGLLAS